VGGGDGWWNGNGLYLEDIVVPGAGHETTPEMADRAVRFVGDVLAGSLKGEASKL